MSSRAANTMNLSRAWTFPRFVLYLMPTVLACAALATVTRAGASAVAGRSTVTSHFVVVGGIETMQYSISVPRSIR
ncbi:hypothetical protein LI328DRAFT_131480 [Trichoderma asperelloides]|nr:hypothetical protein LI328DRAFT_131480 [Trichoderma asperelloides]